ncbi:TPA: hypothetical protein ACX6R5_000256 [Photobacterium damselae]
MTDLVPYRKPYLTSEQLCTKLAEQGLKFEDEQAKKFAANILSRCSYYRFKAYLSPFQDAETKMYNGDTFFLMVTNSINLTLSCVVISLI